VDAVVVGGIAVLFSSGGRGGAREGERERGERFF